MHPSRLIRRIGMFQDVILVYAAVNCETSTNRVFSFGVGDLKTTKIVASINGFSCSCTTEVFFGPWYRTYHISHYYILKPALQIICSIRIRKKTNIQHHVFFLIRNRIRKKVSIGILKGRFFYFLPCYISQDVILKPALRIICSIRIRNKKNFQHYVFFQYGTVSGKRFQSGSWKEDFWFFAILYITRRY